MVVRNRCCLSGVDPSAAVFYVLSDREEAQHRALWPAFVAAKAAGKRAQFHRARLVVDGEPSTPSPSDLKASTRRLKHKASSNVNKRTEMTDAPKTTQETAAGMGEKVKDTVTDAATATKEAGETAASNVKEGATKAGDATATTAGDAATATKSTMQKAVDAVKSAVGLGHKDTPK
ncbi:hypothetical protein FOA52_003234 [Chlamydomonas sp. UWO 241]|nr:hypothetical protein FOA52_003234 [Chlamydomonas sp. UWO 241]